MLIGHGVWGRTNQKQEQYCEYNALRRTGGKVTAEICAASIRGRWGARAKFDKQVNTPPRVIKFTLTTISKHTVRHAQGTFGGVLLNAQFHCHLPNRTRYPVRVNLFNQQVRLVAASELNPFSHRRVIQWGSFLHDSTSVSYYTPLPARLPPAPAALLAYHQLPPISLGAGSLQTPSPCRISRNSKPPKPLPSC